ncbi:MAG: efflux RND transporter periplasmic adaptor subunit [Vicinamibacterales bacterium]
MIMLTYGIPRSHLTARILVGVLVLSAAACARQEAPSAPVQAGAAGPIAIDVARVVEQPLDVQLSLPSELVAYASVAVHPRVAGFVKAVAVDRGSIVRQGDLLVTLDAPELVAQRAEAQSKRQAAEAQLVAARAKADAEAATFDRLRAASATPGVVAGNDVLVAGKAAEASRSQVVAAEEQVEAARQAARAVQELESYLRVTAPFSGVVTERNVHPGALVGPTGGDAAPMVRVVDQRRLRLVVPVPEAYTASLAVGASIPFKVSAFPGTTFTGTVARIARSVDVATRTMAVELDVDNADGRLAPGTFCQVRWPVRRTGPSLFVPTASVASTTDRTFVVRIREGKAEWIDVTTGLTVGPLIEVFGDLTPGDEVAGRGTDELRPGTEVRPRPSKPAA